MKNRPYDKEIVENNVGKQIEGDNMNKIEIPRKLKGQELTKFLTATLDELAEIYAKIQRNFQSSSKNGIMDSIAIH